MKQLHEKTNWQKGIYEDLGFIKKHLRYRYTSGVKTPLIFWSLLIILFGTLMTSYLNVSGKPGTLPNPLPVVMIIPLVVMLYRYVRSLKFIALETGLSLEINRQLLAAFLQKQHLQVFEHPESKDIMQIISIPVYHKNDMREVIVFIADRNRILINSHFTNSGWTMSPGKRHHNQMAHSLDQWIMLYRQQNRMEIQLHYN
jgi:hypothetical protein